MKKCKKAISFLIVLSMLLSVLAVSFSTSAEDAAPSDFQNEYPFVFVHGLNGWGGNEGINGVIPYWGATTGDLMEYLGAEGYECYSASVGPISSAWDRACELYAQLTGGVVDYGVAHSKAHDHLRYGRTYDEPLVKDWGKLDDEGRLNKVHLIGHSFGGTAIRMLAHLLKSGDAAECAAAPDDCSELFKGGKGDWVQSVTSICTPHNSSTLYYPLEFFGLTKLLMYVSITYAGLAGRSLLNGTYFDFHLEQFGLTNIPGENNADKYLRAVRHFIKYSDDMAQQDLVPTGAKEINDYIETNENAYYFSYAFSTVKKASLFGVELPIKETNPLLFLSSLIMGIMSSRKDKDLGTEYGKEWRANDGLVNTISATYPFDEQHTDYNSASIEKGIWNVMPVREGDHGTAIGLLADETKTHEFFDEIAQMLVGIE